MAYERVKILGVRTVGKKDSKFLSLEMTTVVDVYLNDSAATYIPEFEKHKGKEVLMSLRYGSMYNGRPSLNFDGDPMPLPLPAKVYPKADETALAEASATAREETRVSSVQFPKVLGGK